MFKGLVTLMIVLIFSASVAMPIEESQVKANIVAEAITDAVRDVNRTSGSMVEYFFNRIGGGSRRTRIAPIPTGRLLGKPPAYVAAYTVNYQAKQGSLSEAEAIGIVCLVGCGLGCFLLSQEENNRSSNPVDDIFDSISGCSYFGFGF